LFSSRRLTSISLLFILFVSLSSLAIFPVQSTNNTWYVSTTGSDTTGTGTVGNPFATVQKAINKSSTGDIIIIRGGTYTYHNNIVVNRSGTASTYYTIKNFPGEKAILDGSSIPHADYMNAIMEIRGGQSYVRIRGITFNHSYLGGLTVRSSASHIRIDNCTICNSGSFGLKTQLDSYVTIEHNYLYNNHNNWSSISTMISEEGMSIESTSYVYIYGNSFYKNHCENIDLKASVAYAYVYNNKINTTSTYVVKAGQVYYGGQGVYVDAQGMLAQNISIYRNLIYGNNSGIILNNEVGTNRYENITVYDNIINITNLTGSPPTFLGRVGICLSRTGDSTAINKDIKIYMNTINLGANNIFATVQVGSVAHPMYKNYIRRLNITNNILTMNRETAPYYSIFTVYGMNSTDGTAYISLNNNLYNDSLPGQTPRITWQEDSYTKTDPVKWGNSPLFTQPSYVSSDPPYDFHLTSASPCIDAATASLVVSTDYDGRTRPYGSGYDRGAYEYRPSPPNTPPTPTGPTTRITGQAGKYFTATTDPNGDQVQYRFDWNASGNHQYSPWTSLVDSGQTVNKSHTWTSPDTYVVKTQAKDIHGAVSDWSDGLTVTVTVNHAPNKPKKPTGPATRITGQQGTYWANGTDPDGDTIQYRFDWNASGSHQYSGWTSLVNSGTSFLKNHTWTAAGTYLVKAQSRDEHGATSNWSNGLTVTVTMNHAPNQPKKPSGPTTRLKGQQGTYWANGTDPDGDKIQYRFDWNASGSHSYSNWTALVNSGTKQSKQHTWWKPGTYVVKVQSRDEHGATSVWSNGLTVIVTT
jgi:hypothetical protein